MTLSLFVATMGTQSRYTELPTRKLVVTKRRVTPSPTAYTRRCFRKGGWGNQFSRFLEDESIEGLQMFISSRILVMSSCMEP